MFKLFLAFLHVRLEVVFFCRMVTFGYFEGIIQVTIIFLSLPFSEGGGQRFKNGFRLLFPNKNAVCTYK